MYIYNVWYDKQYTNELSIPYLIFLVLDARFCKECKTYSVSNVA